MATKYRRGPANLSEPLLTHATVQKNTALQQLIRQATKRKGFTLTQILVALTIICLLAGLLSAVIGSSRRASKASGCSSNLSQIYLGLSLYEADYDGYFPPYAFEAYGGAVPNQKAFKAALAKYGTSPEQFFCPLDQHRGTDFPGEFYGFKETSYWMAWSVYFNAKIQNGLLVFNPGYLDKPTEIAAFSDMSWREVQPDGIDVRYTSHGTNENVLYFDGHVKSKPNTKP